MSASRKRGSKGRNYGVGSRQPIARIVERQVFYGDAHSEIHLTTAAHLPMPGHDRERLFLHIHAHSESGRKPAALNFPQLATFINRLKAVLETMATSPEPVPVVEVTHTTTKHRVRRRPGRAQDATAPPSPNEADPA